MSATSRKWSGTDSPTETPSTAHYVFRGAVAGLVIGLATLLAATTSYAAMNGYEPVNCAVFGSTMTVLLSQPAGFAGLLVGAASGGVCALIARHTHHS